MHVSKKPIGFWSAVSMGIGAMVGAGIFALLGEASVISGSAVYISFIVGGIVALFSGYSLGKLGACYPSSGGIIEYLSQAYGAGLFTGSMGVMMYFAAVVSLSLVAKAFGNYAITFLPDHAALQIWQHIFSIGVIVLFVLINLGGAKDVAVLERVTVGIKFVVLAGLSVAGIIVIKPELLSTSHYPPINNVFFSIAITFFAYEGFRVITNVAEDMPDPSKTLPRAMVAAILLVMLLYVMIAFAVFGNLPVSQVIAAKDFALAQAALPIFGHVGFSVVAVTALISTASAINANLYAVTNVTYQLAKDGELPSLYGKPIAHSREGLVVSGVFIIVSLLLFDLTEIAAIGSVSILFIHAVTHIGHLKLINETGASKIMIILAVLSSSIALVLSFIYISRELDHIIIILAGFVVVAAVTEFSLQKINKKEIRPRIKNI
ncbi:MAG: amino acid permease [Oceanospirillaceae bacterium]|nr:amino acid permease [Oceanospirillaceae bacterium]